MNNRVLNQALHESHTRPDYETQHTHVKQLHNINKRQKTKKKTKAKQKHTLGTEKPGSVKSE